MAMTPYFSPYAQNNAPGTFNITSTGYMAGTAEDDPVARFALQYGTLNPTESLPMWGGVGVTALVPGIGVGTTDPILGSPVGRATNLTPKATGTLSGFSVFDQNYSMIANPSSRVPLSFANGQVNWYPLLSGARIKVAIDPSLVSLQGGIITPNVSWDFINQRLQPYVASGPTQSLTSLTWSNTNGGQVAAVAAAAVPFGVGDTINISGATNTGSGGNTAVNGTYVINTLTDSTHFTYLLPAAAGVIGTIGGTIVINVGTGALNVTVLRVLVGNCMTVAFNPSTGAAQWNYNDSAAIILI